ncbi:hypothetical protein NDU88_006100 [Pleurodeles waltl]|uniref:Uncharacterized protein n=1 Tax=Pleurodeles waltl TaxID=8319 RepID=A0AAV7W9M5_PLEWA|nr:hypothetical protein NDU88_006100 [Pleurodeles waltl]
MLGLRTLILECNKAITEKADRVATTVALMQQDLDKMREKVKDLGTRTNGLENNVTAHATQLTDHKHRLQMQEAKLTELEAGSQRNNTRILGLLEGIETKRLNNSWNPG